MGVQEVLHKTRPTLPDWSPATCMPGGSSRAHLPTENDRVVHDGERAPSPYPAQHGVPVGLAVVGVVLVRMEWCEYDV